MKLAQYRGQWQGLSRLLSNLLVVKVGSVFRKCLYRVLVEKHEGDHLEDADVDGRIILK